ncbi:MAG: signal peptide peptidase SppA [Actinomycetota bacterium]
MRIERTLMAVVATGLIVLTLTLATLAVTALTGWWAITIVLGVVVVATVAFRALRRRIPKGTVIEIDLDGGVIETMGSDPLSRAMTMRSVTVRDVVDALERGAADPRVTGVVARLGNGRIRLGHAQELRDAVHRFRDSGKKAIAFAEAFGESRSATVDFYLATAFGEIFLQPKGLASVEGIVARGTFVRGVFDKLHLVPDFDHRKEYKAAKYALTETGFNEAHREALGGVAEDQFSQIVSGIAQDRGLSQETVESLIDSAPLTTGETLESGLVDHVGYRDDAYEAAGDRFMFHDRYLKKAGRPHRKGERIALIYGAGSIARGTPRFDPLTRGSSFGADEVAKAFRLASDDDKVKAVVFRVDSPGGSAVASEVASREVARAREKGKPVVVSMGNVAGSGGYWVSAGADRIVAQPGTVTGSIGVVWGKLANREAWRRLGVTFDEIVFGQNATFNTAQDEFSDAERARVTVLLDDIYNNFVAGVAEGRSMTPQQVEEVAKGRIWTGSQARERGLVDELGGLETAVRLAKDLVGIAPEEGIRLVTFPRERALPLPRREESSEPVDGALRALVDMATGIRQTTAGAHARMPWLGLVD